ncbi:helix-turn-helix domain-containing protein [Ruegeria arenilitoris]|uniref:helix-turn-helix domain-containing protein n=1 Tax=Ruegeria arenilitoris TaxID=1173585 RepID=UPI00147DB0EE|nr:helix-turn-helix transcriptional regulator [Ruegeria arenilitoris]
MAFDKKKLKAEMKKKGVSQARLAELLGKGERTVARWLSSKSRLKQDQIESICEVLAITPEEIDEDWKGEVESSRKVAVGARISTSSSNGYYLLKQRYGVTQTQIIELAPLMFAILAKLALQRPEQKLVELHQAYEQADKRFSPMIDNYEQERLAAEIKVAATQDIFEPVPDPMIGISDLDGSDMPNLLCLLFRRLAEGTGIDLPEGWGLGSRCPNSQGIDFDRIAISELTMGDDALNASIINGDVKLDQMDQHLELSELVDERIAWLREKAEAANELRRLEKEKRRKEREAWLRANPKEAKKAAKEHAEQEELIKSFLKELGLER